MFYSAHSSEHLSVAEIHHLVPQGQIHKLLWGKIDNITAVANFKVEAEVLEKLARETHKVCRWIFTHREDYKDLGVCICCCFKSDDVRAEGVAARG